MCLGRGLAFTVSQENSIPPALSTPGDSGLPWSSANDRAPPPPHPASALPHWALPVGGRAPPAPRSHLLRSPPYLGCGDIGSENTLDKEMDQTHARGGRGQDTLSTLELTMSEAGVRTKACRETGLEGHGGRRAGPALGLCPLCSLR